MSLMKSKNRSPRHSIIVNHEGTIVNHEGTSFKGLHEFREVGSYHLRNCCKEILKSLPHKLIVLVSKLGCNS